MLNIQKFLFSINITCVTRELDKNISVKDKKNSFAFDF